MLKAEIAQSTGQNLVQGLVFQHIALESLHPNPKLNLLKSYRLIPPRSSSNSEPPTFDKKMPAREYLMKKKKVTSNQKRRVI
jgi:hypothetical protein